MLRVGQSLRLGTTMAERGLWPAADSTGMKWLHRAAKEGPIGTWSQVGGKALCSFGKRLELEDSKPIHRSTKEFETRKGRAMGNSTAKP